MQIGPHLIHHPFILAPMAGITDLPFRKICRDMGAGLTVAEMISSQKKLRDTYKTQNRSNVKNENALISIQIVGNDPEMMAEAAQFGVSQGADIIDINMGCPAKKVCKKAAGSALLQDEPLVAKILSAVVAAVEVPVTLKIRTGWDRSHKNALNIVKIAENEGIQALSIHGRTRADAFRGDAEYETIRDVKKVANIPIIANGDITSLAKAHEVLKQTKADALMIGRAAFGNPWIFKTLTNGKEYQPSIDEIRATLEYHVQEIYHFYGEERGIRIARKHILWYLNALSHVEAQQRQYLLKAENQQTQKKAISAIFS